MSIVYCYFCTSAPAVELTHGSTSSKLLPNLLSMVRNDNHPKYEFQNFVSQSMKQNSTNDVELVGNVTKVIDGDTLDINGIRIKLSLVDTPEEANQGIMKQRDLLKLYVRVRKVN